MDSQNNSSTKLDVYQNVTDRIINFLEQGIVPWQIPWAQSEIPMNPLTNHPYRGINHWLLLSLNYERNLFLTFNQLESQGGRVKYGEHGHILFALPKLKATSDNSQEQKKNFEPYYYKVYNIEQVRNLPDNLVEPLSQKEHDPIAECARIIQSMPKCPVIKHKLEKPFYDLEGDFINMPKKKSFKNSESYYLMLLHQLLHSTGHKSRLARKEVTKMAELTDDQFTSEELIAEMGANYLAYYAGITGTEKTNNIPYLSGWVEKISSDKRFIVFAASQAQRAIDFVLQRKDNESKDEVNESTEESVVS